MTSRPLRSRTVRSSRQRRRLTLAALAATCLAACGQGGAGGGDGHGGGSPVGGPVGFESYCDTYAHMTCDIAQRCECFPAGGYGLCTSYQQASCHDDVEVPVQQGRRAYDAIEAGQCLAELEAIAGDCNLDDAYWPDACDDMLVGKVTQGGTCEADGDCVAGLECWGDECIVMPSSGQACHPEHGCASGTYCGDDDFCHAEQGPGGPCPEGALACADELYCDPTTDTCQPYVGPSGSCAQASWACDDDLYCSTTSGTCQPYPGQGKSCEDSQGSCADGRYCGDDSICHPELGAGQGCTDDVQCESYSCTESTCEPDEPDVC